MWLSLLPTISIILIFFQFFYDIFNPLILLLILPLLILFYYVIFVLILLLVSKILLTIINLLHEPKEGIFKRDIKRDKDYFFYHLRKTIKKCVFKVFNYFPLPWAKVLALRICDLKIPNSSGILDSYIDTDFIELGEETILGEGSIVMSSIIFGDYLLIKKVILKERCTIGAYSIIAPGTVVEKGAILGMGSYTEINQHLEADWIYIGRPAKKFKKINKKKNEYTEK